MRFGVSKSNAMNSDLRTIDPANIEASYETNDEPNTSRSDQTKYLSQLNPQAGNLKDTAHAPAMQNSYPTPHDNGTFKENTSNQNSFVLEGPEERQQSPLLQIKGRQWHSNPSLPVKWQ